MDISVLGRKETVTGFRLAGVKNTTITADSEADLLRQFMELASRQETSLLIVDDSCSPIKQEIVSFIETNKNPVIVEIPSWNKKIDRGIIDIITQRALGAK